MQATLQRISTRIANAIYLDRRLHLFRNDAVLAKRAETCTYLVLFVLAYACVLYLCWCTYFYRVPASSGTLYTPDAPPACENLHSALVTLATIATLPIHVGVYHTSKLIDMETISTWVIWLLFGPIVLLATVVMMIWIPFLINIVPVIISALFMGFRLCTLRNKDVHDNCSALEIINNRTENEQNKYQ